MRGCGFAKSSDGNSAIWLPYFVILQTFLLNLLSNFSIFLRFNFVQFNLCKRSKPDVSAKNLKNLSLNLVKEKFFHSSDFFQFSWHSRWNEDLAVSCRDSWMNRSKPSIRKCRQWVQEHYFVHSWFYKSSRKPTWLKITLWWAFVGYMTKLLIVADRSEFADKKPLQTARVTL